MNTDRALNAALIAIVSGMVVVAAGQIGFGLWFAPGWSNGLPIPQNQIWPAGLTALVAIAALALTAGGGAALCEAGAGEARFWPPKGWYRGWLLASLMFTAIVAWVAHGILRAQAVGLWP